MTETQRRAKRCTHGFYKGLCSVQTCEHFDGKKTYEQRNQGIVHDAWGRGRRNLKHHETGEKE